MSSFRLSLLVMVLWCVEIVCSSVLMLNVMVVLSVYIRLIVIFEVMFVYFWVFFGGVVLY